MRRLPLLTLCLSAFLLFTNCTKEDLSANGSAPINYNDGTTSSATASGWVTAASLTWSDAAAAADVYAYAEWNAPELLQEAVDKGAVLVYAKTGSAPKLLPALFEKTANDEFDLYRSVAEAQVIRLSHSTLVNGTYTAPAASNEVSFRYIIIKNVSPINEQIVTATGEYTLEQFKVMSYNEVTSALGIAE